MKTSLGIEVVFLKQNPADFFFTFSAQFYTSWLSAPFAGVLFFCLPLFLSVLSLQAKPKATPEPLIPSIGHDFSTSVVRGGSCELDLQGVAMPGEMVEFKIKKNPKQGTLEGPRRIDRESVSFTYRHNGKKSGNTDRVEFGLKTGSGNAWGSLTARISIVEPLPMLLVEDGPLDFGSVRIGEQSSKTLKIRNAGGGVIRGDVKVYQPWSLPQPSNFELVEGAEPIHLKVNFAPVDSGKISGRLEFETGYKPYRVDLRGEGVYRFEVADRFILDEKTKTGFLKIQNLDSKDLSLQIGAPPPLACESNISLPAQGSARLKLDLKEGIYTRKFVDLAIADGSAIRSVRVDLPPSPVRLEWEGAPVFDFGRSPLRNVPERSIGLKNAGATKATVRLVILEGGLRLPPSQADIFEIPAGETAAVKLLWDLPEIPSEAHAKIAARQGSFATELALKAQVEPTSLNSVPVVNEKKPVTPQSPASPKSEKKKLSEAEKKELLLRAPSELKYRLVPEAGATTAIFTWNYLGPKPVKFQFERKVVERRSVDARQVFEKRLEIPAQLPPSPVVVKWIPIPDSEAMIDCLDGTLWKGRVPGLHSGYNEVRIVLTGPPDGKRKDDFSYTIHVGKQPEPAWINWLLAALGLICLVFLLRKKILKKSSE